MSGPLEGVKILEFTSVVLGPWACQMLGDLGADVIKVEPPAGDTNRHLGPRNVHEDMSALFLTCNRNKRSIVLDLKHPKGRKAALKLAEQADVLVHNFRPQAMRRLGLDYETLRAVNPKIIYCATYGYSKKGPYGDKGALDDSIQAGSGVAMLMSMVEGEPRYLPTIVADKTTGMAVVNAVIAALFYRERQGKGQEIEVPMYETMVSYVMVEHLWGLTFDPPIGKAGYVRLMSQHRRPYKTKDGYIAVLPYWDNHWKTFCEVVGRPDMITDPRFNNMKSRLANIDASYAETAKALTRKTTAEWLALLKPTNVPHMIVNTLDGLIDDPHLKETGFWKMVDHPTEGRLRMASPPYSFSESAAEIRTLPPRLGQQSKEILKEAGYGEDEIREMFDQGISKGPENG
ncbi:CaiB/BaiF CoA transferase family protein [Luteithermobacter gelatinilyticus]|uniref:CaiB/BaiF CoA transferase family protein n=1 Tax=Luteithermobacter gelatinilyticus TaxID=2582913 RepID=UPI00110731AE|nr:CoA transferase [Luteithermobacter gelatinilyticus]